MTVHLHQCAPCREIGHEHLGENAERHEYHHGGAASDAHAYIRARDGAYAAQRRVPLPDRHAAAPKLRA
jgi:hypothetical protein